MGFPIRISPDHSSLSTPRSFSQTNTSFIASYCLGIHRMRLFTWPYNPKQPFWLDLFPLLFVVLFVAAVTWLNHAPLLLIARLDKQKISAPIFNYLKNGSDWSIVNAPFEKTLTTEYLPNNNQTTKTIIADIPYANSWLKELRSVDIKRSKVICRAVHDATLNNTTRELKNFCCIALLLYYRFKLLKNVAPEGTSG